MTKPRPAEPTRSQVILGVQGGSKTFGNVRALDDRMWIMRAGRCTGGRRATETTGEEIVEMITETNVVNTAHEALVLADDIGADNVTIEEDDLVSPVREVGDRLGHVHIGENHRGYLGSGHLDFDRFFDALAENVSPTLSNDLAIWRNLWSDGRDLAKHAREFIADQLERAAQQR